MSRWRYDREAGYVCERCGHASRGDGYGDCDNCAEIELLRAELAQAIEDRDRNHDQCLEPWRNAREACLRAERERDAAREALLEAIEADDLASLEGTGSLGEEWKETMRDRFGSNPDASHFHVDRHIEETEK